VIVAFTQPASAMSGGPASFQARFELFLQAAGHSVVYSDGAVRPDVVFVTGGTRRLAWLLWTRWRGARVVHRLDGLHWRLNPLPRDLKPRLTNYVIQLTRKWLADAIVYQSDFARHWWEQRFGVVDHPTAVIHNGAPRVEPVPSVGRARQIVCVEGNYHDDGTTRGMVRAVSHEAPVVLVGAMPERLAVELAALENVTVVGRVDRATVGRYLASASAYLCLELNAPCPNGVIEALMSGVPVVGYATGSLTELVPPDGGVLVDYPGDPWALDVEDHRAIGEAARHALDGADQLRGRLVSGAVRRSLDIEETCRAYIQFIELVVSRGRLGSSW
jgi:glycosyltransferase involved in cell wall biosynthesis